MTDQIKAIAAIAQKYKVFKTYWDECRQTRMNSEEFQRGMAARQTFLDGTRQATRQDYEAWLEIALTTMDPPPKTLDYLFFDQHRFDDALPYPFSHPFTDYGLSASQLWRVAEHDIAVPQLPFPIVCNVIVMPGASVSFLGDESEPEWMRRGNNQIYFMPDDTRLASFFGHIQIFSDLFDSLWLTHTNDQG